MPRTKKITMQMKKNNQLTPKQRRLNVGIENNYKATIIKNAPTINYKYS